MVSSLFSRHDSYQRRWAKIKADPELYSKKLEYQRGRYHLRTEEQKEIINKKMNDWRRSMRRVAKDLGNCSMCFKENDNPKFKMCSICRIKMRKYYKNKGKDEVIISCTGKERLGMSSAGIKAAEFLEALKGGTEDDKDITNTNSNL